MVKVFYKCYPRIKPNNIIYGQKFIDGICEFEDDEKGKAFAELFQLKFEEVIEEKPKKKTTRRVKKNGI